MSGVVGSGAVVVFGVGFGVDDCDFAVADVNVGGVADTVADAERVGSDVGSVAAGVVADCTAADGNVGGVVDTVADAEHVGSVVAGVVAGDVGVGVGVGVGVVVDEVIVRSSVFVD